MRARIIHWFIFVINFILGDLFIGIAVLSGEDLCRTHFFHIFVRKVANGNLI